ARAARNLPDDSPVKSRPARRSGNRNQGRWRMLSGSRAGKRDDFVEPDQPMDPAKDKRIVPGSGPYAVMPNPADGSIWFAVGVFGGRAGFLRFDPATGLSEVYHVPAPAFGIRGGDIDKNGVVWGSLSSSQLASFDRRRCKGPLSGPKATGAHCPEGWLV